MEGVLNAGKGLQLPRGEGLKPLLLVKQVSDNWSVLQGINAGGWGGMKNSGVNKW